MRSPDSSRARARTRWYSLEAFVPVENGKHRGIEKAEEVAQHPIFRLSAEVHSGVPLDAIQSALYAREAQVTGSAAQQVGVWIGAAGTQCAVDPEMLA